MNLKLFGCIFPTLLIIVQTCNAKVCNCDGFICVSDTEFQLCANGEIVGDPIPCVTGISCRNDTENECVSQLLCQENNACSAEGTFPDETSIYRYFTCFLDTSTLEWVKREYTCPEGTYFSQEMNMCDVEEVPDFPLGSEGTNDDAAAEESSLNNLGYICRREGYFPDPQDCQRYYACNGVGTGSSMKCPESTYFDDELLTCSHYIPERCDIKRFPVNVEPEWSSEMKTVRNTEAFFCPGPGYFPDPQNCRKYYQCDEYKNTVLKYCPDSTCFDSTTGICKPYEDIGASFTMVPNTEEYTTVPSDGADTDTTIVQTTQDTTVPSDGANTDTTIAPTTQDTTIPSDGANTDTTIVQTTQDTTIPSNGANTDSTIVPTTQDTTVPSDGANTDTTIAPTTQDTTIPSDGANTDTTIVQTTQDTTVPSDGADTTIVPTTEDTTVPSGIVDTDTTIVPTTEDTTVPSGIVDTDTTIVSTTSGDLSGFWTTPRISDNTKDFPTSSSKTPHNNNNDDERTSKMPDETDTSITQSYRNDVASTSAIPPSAEEFICSAEGYFPDPNNCQFYYICIEGHDAVRVSCPENTFYEEDSTFCVSDMPTRCVKKPPSEDKNYETTTTVNELTSMTPPTSEDENFTCTGEGYLQDPNNCHRYFVCYEFGHPVPITCPKNTFFDQEYAICTLKKPKSCNLDEPEKPTRPPEGNEKEFICPGRGTFPDPADCQKYWICYGRNFGFAVTCPSGTYYHEGSSICLKKIPARCKGSGGAVFKCPGNGYFPDPVDCRSYHVCYSWGLHLSTRCGGNTYFNEETRSCTLKKPERCVKSKREKEFVCPGVGYYTNHRDCTKFYVCDPLGGVSVAKCPENRYFNEETGLCSASAPRRCQNHQHHSRTNGVIFPMALVPPGKNPILFLKHFEHANTTMKCGETNKGEDCSEKGDRDNSENSSLEDSQEDENFDCKTPGLFPDLRDCKRFYECSSGLEMKHKTCSGRSSFNEVLRFCSYFPSRRCSKDRFLF